MSIWLEERKKEHVVTAFERMADPEIQALFPRSTNTIEESLSLYEASLQEDAKSYGRVILQDGEYIGDVWLYAIDEKAKTANFSIAIFEKKAWSKSIGYLASGLFLRDALFRYELKSIRAFCYEDNQRAVGMLQNLGFIQKETFEEEGRRSLYLELSCENALDLFSKGLERRNQVLVDETVFPAHADGMTSVDGYYIPDEEVDAYLKERAYYGKKAEEIFRRFCPNTIRDWAGTQDGEAVLGLDEKGKLMMLIHLDPTDIETMKEAEKEGNLEEVLLSMNGYHKADFEK